MVTELQVLSNSNVITVWNIFEVDETKVQYLIGYSSNYKFDVITPALASFAYNPNTKSGRAITKTGSIYMLDGKPMRFNPKGHLLLKEFIAKHDCQITFVKL
ncbi:MAG: hypothetical protein MUQ51_02515 [Pseudomonadota bacterium]|nr:hypothetical protein [Pseudomonadota bacterium]MDO7710486.1 hypothetical protein [Pseudomonadota bacterium]